MLAACMESTGFQHCTQKPFTARWSGTTTCSASTGWPLKPRMVHVCKAGGEKITKAAENDERTEGRGKAESIPYARQAFWGVWSASGMGIYALLSSDAVILPKLGLGAVCTSVLTPFVLKVLLGDRFQVELHRGRLYFQLLEVPPNGPSIPAGAVQVRPTGDVRGNGAYAVAPIMKGQRVCDYEGELIDVDEYWERYGPSGTSDYVMRIDDEYALDATELAPQTAQFSAVHMNHSRRPNVGRFYARSENRVSFYALRDISVGEEITIDYGREFWMGREGLEV